MLDTKRPTFMTDGTKETLKQLSIGLVTSCAPLFVAWGIDEVKRWMRRDEDAKEQP